MTAAVFSIALLPTAAEGRDAVLPTAAQNQEYDVPLPYLTPVPVVRLAGQVTRTGVRITLLRVKAPRSSLITVRCSGGRRRGCPAASTTRSSPRSGNVRFRRLERRLRAGVKLTVFVRRGNTIGKFTRFTIRRRKAPARRDACLFPGDPFEPRSCP